MMFNRFHRLHPPENGVPPEQVRFEEVRVESWPDGRRVRVHLRITPFLQPPNLEMVILAGDAESARIAIIENIDFQLVFTMHLRIETPDQRYTLLASIRYDEIGIVDEQQLEFDVQPQDGE